MFLLDALSLHKNSEFYTHENKTLAALEELLDGCQNKKQYAEETETLLKGYLTEYQFYLGKRFPHPKVASLRIQITRLLYPQRVLINDVMIPIFQKLHIYDLNAWSRSHLGAAESFKNSLIPLAKSFKPVWQKTDLDFAVAKEFFFNLKIFWEEGLTLVKKENSLRHAVDRLQDLASLDVVSVFSNERMFKYSFKHLDFCVTHQMPFGDQTKKDGALALYNAAKYDQLKIMELLLQSGAVMETVSKYEGRPIHIAAQKGYYKIVEQCLMAGEDVNITGGFKKTPLYFAAFHDHFKVAVLLLQWGAEPRLCYNSRNNAIRNLASDYHIPFKVTAEKRKKIARAATARNLYPMEYIRLATDKLLEADLKK